MEERWPLYSGEFERFLDRQKSCALLYSIHSCYVRKNPKHCPYCTKSVGYYKRQYLTGRSCHRSLTGKILMFLDRYSIMEGGHLQCTRVGFTWNLSLTVMLWGREVRGWVFWFCQTRNAGSMFTTFRGWSRGGNFQPWVDKSLLFPILNASAHQPHG